MMLFMWVLVMIKHSGHVRMVMSDDMCGNVRCVSSVVMKAILVMSDVKHEDMLVGDQAY